MPPLNSSRGADSAWLPDIAAVPPAFATPEAGAGERVRAALANLKLPQLRSMAAARLLPVRGGQREALLAAVAESLLDATDQAALTGALGQPARAVLALALSHDWSHQPMTPSTLRRLLRGGSALSGDVDGAMTQLADLGLLLPHPQSSPRGDSLFAPAPGLLSYLLPLLPEIRAYTADLPGPGPGDADVPAEALPLRKVAALMAALQAGEYHVADEGSRDYRGLPTQWLGRWEVVGEIPPVPSRPGRDDPPTGLQIATGRPVLAGDGLARLRDASGLGSTEETRFFLYLLEALQLLHRTGLILQVAPGAVDEWQASPAVARLAAVVRAALVLNNWSELDMLIGADPGLGLFRNTRLRYAEPSHMRDDVSRVRQALAALLAWLPVGPWYDVAALLSALHRLFPELPVTTQPAAGAWEQATWWLARRTGAGEWQPLDRRSTPDWMRGLGRLAATCLRGPLTWLGLVSVTALDGTLPPEDRPAPPAGFRLTPLGGDLLSRRPPGLRRVPVPPAGTVPDAGRGPALTFRSGGAGGPLLALNPHAAGLDDQIALGQVADLQRAETDLYLYQLTPSGARRAFDAGLHADGLRALLDRLAGGDVPPALTDLLTGWWEAYGRVRYYTGVTLVQFTDEYVLPELMLSTALPRYLLYQFSPRLIAVAAADVDALLADLARAGHTPRVVDGPASEGRGA